jgi:hypothetical protein
MMPSPLWSAGLSLLALLCAQAAASVALLLAVPVVRLLAGGPSMTITTLCAVYGGATLCAVAVALALSRQRSRGCSG